MGVARQTVYTWKALLDGGGIDGLRAVPERGRPAQLDQAQLASVRAALLQSPTEHGFGTELWTLKRVELGTVRRVADYVRQRVSAGSKTAESIASGQDVDAGHA